MCGIFGIYSPSKKLNYTQFERSLYLIKHREPDFSQTRQIDEHVIFGHTRLSIIDLSASIYDFIRNSLIKIGFATPLDKLMTESKQIENILLNQKSGDLFDNKNVARLLSDYRRGKDNHSTLLFQMLCAKIWYKTFFE
jgi:hypothetical protein